MTISYTAIQDYDNDLFFKIQTNIGSHVAKPLYDELLIEYFRHFYTNQLQYEVIARILLVIHTTPNKLIRSFTDTIKNLKFEQLFRLR